MHLPGNNRVLAVGPSAYLRRFCQYPMPLVQWLKHSASLRSSGWFVSSTYFQESRVFAYSVLHNLFLWLDVHFIRRADTWALLA